MKVVLSKNAFLFNLNIEEAIFFSEAFEKLAQII